MRSVEPTKYKKGRYTRFPFKRKHVVKKLRCRLPSRIIEITRAETVLKIGYLKDFYDTVIHIPVNLYNKLTYWDKQ